MATRRLFLFRRASFLFYLTTSSQFDRSGVLAGPERAIFNRTLARIASRGSFREPCYEKWGCTMSVMFSKLQSSFFSQTAAFCAVGLCVSFVVVLAYDLRIADVWI